MYNQVVPIELKPEVTTEFNSLYTAGSAREAITAATEIVQSRSKDEQRDLLLNSEFQKPVQSAIVNLDQRSGDGTQKIVDSFDEDLQTAASYIFGRD